MRIPIAIACAVLGAGWLAAQDRTWVEESNHNAQILLQAQAKLSPESAGRVGLWRQDAGISPFSPSSKAGAVA